MPERTSLKTNWFFSLASKICQVVPYNTAAAIVLTLVSQAALLISLLLPLKIIMLMATGGSVRYLPEFLKSISTETFILSLVFLTLVFYLIQHIAEKLGKITIDKSAQKLLNRSQKITLFENQNEIATGAYKKFTAVLSSLIFCIIVLGALSFVYFEITIVVLFYFLACSALNISIWMFSKVPKDEIQKKITQNIPSIINIGFFVIFLFIVADYLYLTPPAFIIALITIILSRQILAQFGDITRDIVFLLKHKEKISSLFFQHKVFSDADKTAKSSLWELLINDSDFNWVKLILTECFNEKPVGFNCSWYDTGIDSIACFEVNIHGANQKLLLKLFDTKRLSLAQHEASLLVGSPSDLPSPQLILTTQINNLPCHVFDITDLTPVQDISLNGAARKSHQESRFSVEPPAELVSRYCRSREIISHRIKLKALRQLEIIATHEEKKVVLNAIQLLPKIRESIDSLPLSIVNKDTNAKIFLSDSHNNLKLLHWGKWTLEPLGATWPVSETSYTGLHSLVKTIAKKRPEVLQHEMSNYELASLLSNFERKLQKHYYKEALALLPSIMERVENHQAVDFYNSSTLINR